MNGDLRAHAGVGALAPFHDAGVLDVADVHVATRVASLAEETSPLCVLALALTVRAARLGSVCVELNQFTDVTTDLEDVDVAALPWPGRDELEEALRASALITGTGSPGLRPLRLAETGGGTMLYLDRYFRQEAAVRRVLELRAQSRPSVDLDLLTALLAEHFPDEANPSVTASAPSRSRVATALAATQWTTFVTGGPGTGKTHAVARILAVLRGLQIGSPRVALAAPTGKAAARMTEELNEHASGLGLPQMQAVTLHRLLGSRRDAESRFRHNRSNRLPFDVVIVDETSMVSLSMMASLLEALRLQTRVVFLGDPDQLASIDAGAVLADLVAAPVTGGPSPALAAAVNADLNPQPSATPGGVTSLELSLDDRELEGLAAGRVRLTRGRRYDRDIGELAAAIRDGDADRAVTLLERGGEHVSWCQPEDLTQLRADTRSSGVALVDAARDRRVEDALAALGSHRVLCAHREGPHGVRWWGDIAREWVTGAAGTDDDAGWYAGQPLLITGNDYDVGLYNGDTGVVIDTADRGAVAAFERATGPLVVPVTRLSAVATAYAMTVHRSQGSQYVSVSVVLPPPASRLLTRQLLYTAVTRAREHVRVVGTEQSVRAAVSRRLMRASGLRHEIQSVT